MSKSKVFCTAVVHCTPMGEALAHLAERLAELNAARAQIVAELRAATSDLPMGLHQTVLAGRYRTLNLSTAPEPGSELLRLAEETRTRVTAATGVHR